ncbi:MAG TPA: hypothetical protein VN634_08270 [Candidatus Limnocylindrales bacterium]|jgi:hypothetical protein|nr:hypothetical protein [Candidatus Limnocylindrales bacterium]
MNETTAETQAGSAADDLAARQLHHVGAAYGLVFLLVFFFAWRATQATRRLSERIDELKSESRMDEIERESDIGGRGSRSGR